jgi:hypothetical protein
MLVGDKVHDRLVEFVVTARLTVPLNTLTGVMLVVEPPATAVLTVTMVGLTPMAKSTT